MQHRRLATVVSVAGLVGSLTLAGPAWAAQSAGHNGKPAKAHCDGVKRKGIVSCSALLLSDPSTWKGHHVKGVKSTAPAGYGPPTSSRPTT